MKIKILPSALADLDRGRIFDARQSKGIGDYFLDSLFSDIDALELYAGVHIKVFNFHRLLSRTITVPCSYCWVISNSRARRRNVMRELRVAAIVSLVLLGTAMSGSAEAALSSETPEARAPAPAVLCKEAVVNPVSGYAECVRPPGAPVAPPPPRPSVVKLAVFDFELDDVSPAASFLGQTTSDESVMQKVSSEARRMLAESGRFILVDVGKIDAEPVRAKSLRNCNGCEAGIALQAGAEQALIGMVRRVTQTDYYVLIQFSDAHTGKVLNQQEANFAGGPDGWASGVRMLIKHQVLVAAEEP